MFFLRDGVWIIWNHLILIDFNLLSTYVQLISIDFQFISIYCQLISIDFQLISIYFQVISIDFNWCSIDFNLPWKNVWVQFFYWVLKRHPIFWEIRHFENSKRIELSKKEKSIRKGKGKEKRILENVHFQKELDTIEDPPQQTYYWRSGLLMGYPLEKLFGCCFVNGVLIRHPIFWEINGN